MTYHDLRLVFDFHQVSGQQAHRVDVEAVEELVVVVPNVREGRVVAEPKKKRKLERSKNLQIFEIFLNSQKPGTHM